MTGGFCSAIFGGIASESLTRFEEGNNGSFEKSSLGGRRVKVVASPGKKLGPVRVLSLGAGFGLGFLSFLGNGLRGT